MNGEGREQSAVLGGDGAAATQHDQVDTMQTMTAPAKALAHDALQTATVNRPPRALLGDRKPQSRRLAAVAPSKNGKTRIDRLFRFREDVPEIPWPSQACVAR